MDGINELERASHGVGVNAVFHRRHKVDEPFSKLMVKSVYHTEN